MDAIRSPGGRYGALALFLVVVLGVGFTIGLTIRPGMWYQGIEKPVFTPPNWVFGPVWTVVYLLIAVAGWRIWTIYGAGSRLFGLWIVQMLLNWAWTPVFFGAHLMGLGLVTILTLLGVVLVMAFTARDRVVSLCLAPYCLWLGYASALNGAIWLLN